MMLAEEGRFVLSDPIGAYLPALAKLQVAVPRNGQLALEPARADVTIHDLLRHTSGLTYAFRANHLQSLYAELDRDILTRSNAEVVDALGQLPLAFQPGSRWEYGRSTDVLGRLVEVVAGMTLGEFLRARIFTPLGMRDTGFHVPETKWARLAEAGPDPATGQSMPLLPVRHPPRFEMGGGGLVSTAPDYLRFAQLLLGGGELEGVRLLSPRTLAWMTADHLGTIPPGPAFYPGPGYGFGLGFAVRTAAGLSAYPGSLGEYYWTGAAGTSFWVDPREQLIGIVMVQLPPVLPLLQHYWFKLRAPVLQSLA
jgi:CubicO group peptidase (beta-lactamase class C family)